MNKQGTTKRNPKHPLLGELDRVDENGGKKSLSTLYLPMLLQEKQ